MDAMGGLAAIWRRSRWGAPTVPVFPIAISLLVQLWVWRAPTVDDWQLTKTIGWAFDVISGGSPRWLGALHEWLSAGPRSQMLALAAGVAFHLELLSSSPGPPASGNKPVAHQAAGHAAAAAWLTFLLAAEGLGPLPALAWTTVGVASMLLVLLAVGKPGHVIVHGLALNFAASMIAVVAAEAYLASVLVAAYEGPERADRADEVATGAIPLGNGRREVIGFSNRDDRHR